MKMGVPKEIKPNEYRVAITPEAAREYLAALQAGLNVCRGQITSSAVATSLDMPFVPPLETLQAA